LFIGFHENHRVLEVYETNQKEQFFGSALFFLPKDPELAVL
jgi:hypothetical protein